MNREVLFRGKRIDTGEWIEGFYVKDVNRNKHYIFTGIEYISGLKMQFREWDCVEVIHVSICQYTGIRDKNGYKIFERDIIQRDIFGELINGEIVWSDSGFTGFYVKVKAEGGYAFYPIGRGQACDDEGERNDDLVIGNVFDYSALLENVDGVYNK